MKKIIITTMMFILFLLGTLAWAGDVTVEGYYRSDGTYVAPHHRSAPDGNPYNNWSTKGNVNPYTGQPGYKNVYPKSSGGYYSPYKSPYKK